MFNVYKFFSSRLVSKLILTVGLVFVISVSTWAFFNVRYQKEKVMQNIVAATDRLTTTIRLGTQYAMMLNSRDDINQIINNISKLPEIKNIRIYNKAGEIKFSNQTAEVDQATNIKAEACDICHRSDPPLAELQLSQRTRIFHDPNGIRYLGIISPIGNEPGCSTDGCHIHPAGKLILGALDLVVSLEQTDKEILHAERGIVGMAIFVFLSTSIIIFFFVMRFVNRPVKTLINRTQEIARGNYGSALQLTQNDEMGQLGIAIDKMGQEIAQKERELNKQRDEYMLLFEQVPCLITVQDKDYKLLRYNKEFSDRFDPRPGDYCFHAYKGLSEKCDKCPVEWTFESGKSFSTEETGVDKDGSRKHWIVRTTPIVNSEGDIVAAMEISLDITERKQLEVDLERSEKKYHAIFNNIPNPVFVLDQEDMKILDCNMSVQLVYGYSPKELIHRSFLDFFKPEEKAFYAQKLKTTSTINQVKHINRDHKELFVNIRSSPSEYSGKEVLLVTTSDITKRLETEQQLIQASKIATLGEMATGVAHELNQPLSVIKTASSFFMKKIERNEEIPRDILYGMLFKVDANVDRASKIINHMRQFARKSSMEMEKVHVHEVLAHAFEIFSQQLKVRGIDVVWEMAKHLPKIHADPDRLEQVFINLLLNARDAIEEKWLDREPPSSEKKITLRSGMRRDRIFVEVCDTGAGIPDDIKDKIFEPFYTTKEVGKGTGLGLSISYSIVKEFGGEISATSHADQGSCFTVSFPVPPAQTGPGKSKGPVDE